MNTVNKKRMYFGNVAICFGFSCVQGAYQNCVIVGHYKRTDNKQLGPVRPYTQTKRRNPPKSKYFSR